MAVEVRPVVLARRPRAEVAALIFEPADSGEAATTRHESRTYSHFPGRIFGNSYIPGANWT
jgi:hypothetical protein